MDRAPDAYHTETTTTSSKVTCGVNTLYPRHVHGILRILELIVAIIVLIIVGATNQFSWRAAGGYLNFTAALCLIVAATFFCFNLFNVLHRLPGPWDMIEFFSLILCAVLWFIAFIVALSYSMHGAGPILTAIFGIGIGGLEVAQLIIRFRVERQSSGFSLTVHNVPTPYTLQQQPPHQQQPIVYPQPTTDAYPYP